MKSIFSFAGCNHEELVELSKKHFSSLNPNYDGAIPNKTHARFTGSEVRNVVQPSCRGLTFSKVTTATVFDDGSIDHAKSRVTPRDLNDDAFHRTSAHVAAEDARRWNAAGAHRDRRRVSRLEERRQRAAHGRQHSGRLVGQVAGRRGEPGEQAGRVFCQY